jgi:hypothetical protein
MRQSDSIIELATALAKAQGQIDDATKTGLNPAFKSRYADLAAVRAAIKEPLAVNDLAIVQLPRTLDGSVEVETMIIHKSGEFIAETLRMPVNKWDAHGIGSGITYGRRYGLMSMLGIAADDDDGNGAVDRTPVAVQPVKKAQPEISNKLKSSANEAANQGTIGLNNWWKTLTPDERNSISEDYRSELKKIAAEKDGKSA